MPVDDHLRRDFEERLRPHACDLLRFVRRSLRRPMNAPDVLQNVLVQALERHDRFDREASFKAWIYRFATHEVHNENRRCNRYLELGADDVEVPEEIEIELAYEQVLADPDAALDGLDDALSTVLAELSDSERAAFLLRSLADLSCGEIASIMQVPKGTVMSWLFRVRARLRRNLASYARAVGWRSDEL